MFAERHLTFLKYDVLDELCEVHGCQLWGRNIPRPDGGYYSKFCPECTQAEKQRKHDEQVAQLWKNHQRNLKYGALERESIISPELKLATFDSYVVQATADQIGLDFAKKMTRHYYQGGTGNVLLSGKPGQGKSHLALSMLRTLNETYTKKEDYKSAIFMPVAQLFTIIQDSFNKKSGRTEADMVKLLTECDFLVLDDLGKESSYSHELKRANEWKQSVLFQIFDHRPSTIITTNFTAEQLSFIYDPALYSRLLKGDAGMKLRLDESITDKR